jgi:hypothetical protein
MGADKEGSATGMSRATKLKVEDRLEEDGAWAGIPSLSLQQLWFSIQRHEWSSLVAVPADRDMPVMDFVKPLYDVGRLAMGENLRLVDARDVKLTRTAPLIVEITGGATRGKGGERVLVVIDSVLSHPSGVPVALATDAALLCVEMGKTSIAAARETLQIVGAQRFLGCITLPRP